MTIVESAIEALRKLPAHATMDDVVERIQIMASIERAREDIKMGRIYTQEQAEELSRFTGLPR